MFKLRVTAKAKRQLKLISKAFHQQAIVIALQEIREDPSIGKILSRDFTGSLSYKVGVYRIIYKIDLKNNSVIILTAGHRSNVYK